MTLKTAYPQQRSADEQAEVSADWRARWQILVGKLTLLHSKEERDALLTQLCNASDRPVTVAFVNAHALNMAAKDAAFFHNLMSADVLLRDGVGVSMLLSMLGIAPGKNMNGTDFIPLLLDRYESRSVALFGTRQAYLEAAAHALASKGRRLNPTILDGFQPDAAYAKVMSYVRPELVVLGMGMPKQEAVAALLRTTCSYPHVTVCGGAIIDFLGGKVRRAPHVIRGIGFEWLYRLCMEPRRLFRRYVVGNPVFIARAIVFSLRRT